MLELEIKKHLIDSCKSVFSSLGFKGGGRKVSIKIENATLQLIYLDGGHFTDGNEFLWRFNYSYAIYFHSLNKFFHPIDDIKGYQTIKSDIGGALIEKINGRNVDGDMWVKYSSINEVDGVVIPALHSSCASVIKKVNEDEYYLLGRQRWREGNRSAINFILRMICLASLRGDNAFFDEILHDIRSTGSSWTLRAANEVLRKIEKPEIS
jgi:hypothetical protein